jgi:hypothetical protein
MNLIQKLQDLIALKRTAIAELFSAYTIQTELEYDFALERLEFRYDDEYDFTLFEAKMSVLTDFLKEADASIMLMQQKIEYCSHHISTL